MKWFRQRLFSRVIGYLCIALMGINPLISIAMANIEYDEPSHMAVIYSPLKETDADFKELITKVSHDSWSVINKSDLNLEGQTFSSLTRMASFYNAGHIYCTLQHLTDMTMGNLNNDGDISFVMEGIFEALTPFNLTVQSFSNDGKINFITSLKSSPITWKLKVLNDLQRLGQLHTKNALVLETPGDKDFVLNQIITAGEFSTLSSFTIGLNGILDVGRMIIPPKKAYQILTNHGTATITSICQKGKLRVHNTGVFELTEGDGLSFLEIMDNSGKVKSALPVFSRYSREFFKSDPLKGKTLIQGTLQSDKDIYTQFPKEQKAQVVWKQSLITKGNVRIKAPYSQIRLEGPVKASGLFIQSQRLTGQGLLTVKEAFFKGQELSVSEFTWAEILENLKFSSTGFMNVKLKTKDSFLFQLKGKFEVCAPQIETSTAIDAQQGIVIITDQMEVDQERRGGPSFLKVNQSLGSKKGNVQLQSQTLIFNKDTKGSIQGQNIILHDLNGKTLDLPSSWSLKSGDLVVMTSPRQINLHGIMRGKRFFAKSNYIFINSVTGPKKLESMSKGLDVFGGFKDGIFIESDILRSSIPLETQKLIAKFTSLLIHDIYTKSFSLEGEFAAFDKAMIFSMEHSHLGVDKLKVKDTTMKGTLTLGNGLSKGTHHLEGIEGSQVTLVQEVEDLVFEGKSKISHLAMNHTTTVTPEAELFLDQMDSGDQQKGIHLLGKVRTEQKDVQLKAGTIIILDLKPTKDERFESLELEGLKGHIEGTLSSKDQTLGFKESLELRHAHLVGEKVEITSKDIKAPQSSITSSKTQIEGETVDIQDLSVNARDLFELIAEKAKLSPDRITTDRAEIYLKDYPEGLKGVIKLAHDLVNCKSVYMDAKNETLTVDTDTHWRPNITLALQKASVFATLESVGDIGLKTEEGVYVQGILLSKNLELTAKTGDIRFFRALLKAAKDMKIKAEKGDIHVESEVERVYDGNGFHDRQIPTILESGHDLNMDAPQGEVDFKGGVTESGNDTLIKAKSGSDKPVTRVSQTTSGDQKTQIVETITQQIVGKHKAGGKYEFITEGDQVQVAPEIEAKVKTTLQSTQGRVILDETHEKHESTTTSKSGGGFFGGSKTTQEHSESITSKGAVFRGGPVEILSKDDITLTNITARVPKVILVSLEGAVKILLGTNSSFSQKVEQSSNVFWQTQTSSVDKSQTFSPSKFDGDIEITAREVLVETIKGQTLDFIKRIHTSGVEITMKELEELHFHDEQSTSGPTAALGAVVALAIGMTTGGVASTLGGKLVTALGLVGPGSTTYAGVVSAMGSAGFKGLCTKGAIALLSNKGDIGASVKSLTSDATLKSLGITMLASGLANGVGAKLGVVTDPGVLSEITKECFMEGVVAHLQSELLTQGIGAGLSITIGGEDKKEILENGLRSVISGVIGGVGANCIGASYNSQDIDAVTHKILHGILGGTSGYILGGKKGIQPGVLGAIVSESLSEVMITPYLNEMAIEAEFEGGVEGREKLFKAKLEAKADMVVLTTAILLTAFGEKNVGIAIETATNAVHNNCLPQSLKKAAMSWVDFDTSMEIQAAEEIATTFEEKLAQAEIEALKKIKARKELLESQEGTSLGDDPYHDIIEELKLEKQRIVQERKESLGELAGSFKDTVVYVDAIKETVEEIGQEVSKDPWGTLNSIRDSALKTGKQFGQEIIQDPLGMGIKGVKKGVYETLDVLTPGGLDNSYEWLEGKKTFTQALSQQKSNIQIEMAMGFLGTAVKSVGKIAKLGGGHITEKVMEKVAKKGGVQNKGPYNPREMDKLLKEHYGSGAVSSSTLPDLSKPNVKMAGKNIIVDTTEGKVSVVFDTRGFPIFDPYVKFETRISAKVVTLEDSKAHMRCATKELRDAIGSGKVNDKVFSVEQIKAITGGQSTIPGFTWHHHQDVGRMQLIPDEIHKKVAHQGGFSLWGKQSK